MEIWRQRQRKSEKKTVLAELFCVASIHQDIHMLCGFKSHGFFLVIAQIAPHNMIYENDECLRHICNQIILLGSHPVKWIMHTVDTRHFHPQHSDPLYNTMKYVTHISLPLWKLILNLHIFLPFFALRLSAAEFFKKRHQFAGVAWALIKLHYFIISLWIAPDKSLLLHHIHASLPFL